MRKEDSLYTCRNTYPISEIWGRIAGYAELADMQTT